MAQFAGGVSYTPFFSQGMGAVADAITARRERGREQHKNELAQAAYMGDPQALVELAAVDPELARQTEDQAMQRQKVERQTRMEGDTAFQEFTRQTIEDIAKFPDYQSARAYGQRRTEELMARFPERAQQAGRTPEFTEEVFNQMKAIGGPGAGQRPGTVGSPGFWTDSGGKNLYRGVVLEDGSTQVTDPQTNRPMTLERRQELGIVPTGNLDSVRAGEIKQAGAYGAGIGAAEATVETAADVAEAEAGAEAAAQAMVDLPQMAQQTTQTINIMNEIRDDPALEAVTGLSAWLDVRNAVPGTPQYDLKRKIDQVQGEVFRQAFQSLKGGGQITEFESQAAGQAIAQLAQAQSKEAFLEALDRFETAMRDGFAKLERQRQQDFSYTPLPQPRGAGGTSTTTETETVTFTQDNPATPASKADYDALPAGSFYTAPDGSLKRKR